MVKSDVSSYPPIGTELPPNKPERASNDRVLKYKSISEHETLVFLLQLQQVIIDLYSRHYVKTITPQEAQGMLTLMSWGMHP
jgi:hypothetical protein